MWRSGKAKGCAGGPASRLLPIMVAAVLAAAAPGASRAAEPVPLRLAVFDFQLDDRSAAGGVVAKDAIDDENLRKTTELARQRLAASGRYVLVDTDPVAAEFAAAQAARRCDGCEAGLGRKLGADQSMIGIVARVSRSEYSLQLVVRDARTGAILFNAFSGLRMGANYAWPRAVTSLIDNKILQ